MKSKQLSATFHDYITVRQAALLLGVSAATLRNWDRAGKLKAKRHPINGYRLYSVEDLQRLVNKLQRKETTL